MNFRSIAPNDFWGEGGVGEGGLNFSYGPSEFLDLISKKELEFVFTTILYLCVLRFYTTHRTVFSGLF